MRYTISGKNLDVSDSLRSAIQDKLKKVERYFAPDTEAQITLSIEKGRQRVEITIPTKGQMIRAEQETQNMYLSIDQATDVIVRQIKKYKNKMIDRKRGGGSFTPALMEEEAPSDGEIVITRTKHFELKPMDPEEACVQMELLGHNFFVFRDRTSEAICVAYKRNDGTYGLIEPE